MDRIEDKAEKEVIQEMLKLADDVDKMVDDLPKLENKRPATIKAYKEKNSKAITKIKTTIEALETKAKTLKSPAAKKAANNIIIRAGKKAAIGLAAKGILKLIPVVNVISTAWDVVWMGIALYNWCNSAPSLTEEDAERMTTAKEKEDERARRSENPRNKKYVILRVWEGLQFAPKARTVMTAYLLDMECTIQETDT